MGKWSGQWAARGVPGLRAELATAFESSMIRQRQYLDAKIAPSVRKTAEDLIEQNRVDAFRLGNADLYWVTADLAAQALDASQDVPGFAPADLPCTNGLVVFGGPLPNIDTPPLTLIGGTDWAGQVPVWGLWWHPRDAQRIEVEVLTRIGALPAPMTRDSELQQIASLLISRDAGLIFGDVGELFDTEGRAMPREWLGVLAFLGAMSVLMMTPTVAERRALDARSGRAPVEGRTRPIDLVSTVDLRPLRHVTTDDEPGEGGREYRTGGLCAGIGATRPTVPAGRCAA